jgi:tRNA pseudouridine32 synthase / 23S rRNA pseudouridine746 synthase
MKSLNPSRAYLPKLTHPPATIFDHLVERFPLVGRDAWLGRIERGLVCGVHGETITADTPYMPGLTITYYREVVDEPVVPFAESIIYHDENILIADKPHFLPVTPTGPYVNECLLARLQRRTGLHQLSPIHRLDLETAGLVLFVVKPELRHRYHRLFAEERVEKEYLAVASVPDGITQREWLVENRMEAGEPWFRMKIVEGEPNARTHITLLEERNGLGLFRLLPRSGKKHQLRVHMASLGFPILNDGFYPDAPPAPAWDYERPLQLLARRLEFCDPVTGNMVEAASALTLTLSQRERE